MKDSNSHQNKEKYIDKIGELIDALKFGTITIIVQDGKVIQLEKNEKIRL